MENEYDVLTFDPAAQNRVPWNFGAGPASLQSNSWAIRFFLDREQRVRDRALFDLAIDSKLRGCDLVELKIGDLVSGPEVRKRAAITQRKTGSRTNEKFCFIYLRPVVRYSTALFGAHRALRSFQEISLRPVDQR